mmetsp:Transcript_144341/g.269088  ORF Transcript_144341/g.269088 Transcript_144341/m.269088 type:complete len:1081 (-) Transcript_144341:64-3306(-)
MARANHMCRRTVDVARNFRTPRSFVTKLPRPTVSHRASSSPSHFAVGGGINKLDDQQNIAKNGLGPLFGRAVRTNGEIDALLQEHFSGWSDAVKVFRMLFAFRRRGHLAAKLDPLRGSLHRNLNPQEPIGWRIGGVHGTQISAVDVCQLLRDYPERLDLSVFGFTNQSEDDLLPEGVRIPASWPSVDGPWTFRMFIDHLIKSYCGTLSIEHQHIDSPYERQWLEDRLEERSSFEAVGAEYAEEQRRALLRLVQADQMESFFTGKYPYTKRFGIEGCEALLPGLWALLEKATELDVRYFQIGMAHRGRLNVLVNVLGKEVSTVCSEFDERPNEMMGDVKYHLGTTTELDIGERTIQLSLAPNPSHLELVCPVVLGMTRAKQDYLEDTTMRRTMAVLLHGDAAFSGQGVVAESMQLADLPAYTTGGSIHIVVNNLVGFTTDPRCARSSFHCTNVAKVNDAPIIHVNADDVDAVRFACSLAAEYRDAFRKDVVVDLVCYRRHGHSELDDPALTQPLTRTSVERHPPVLKTYSQKLIDAGVVSREEVEAMIEEVRGNYESEYNYASSQTSSISEWRVKHWQERPCNVTGMPQARLRQIGRACSQIPEGFTAHKTVQKVFEARNRMLAQGTVDWALAEILALGSLLLKFDPSLHLPWRTSVSDPMDDTAGYREHPPCPVRLSGQDVERGTFNQRHAIIFDQRTAQPHSILNNMNIGPQSRAEICNSSLSELAILGYEYGHSLEEGLALTIWEAQFGDFANCAQPYIDNFIACGEAKWDAKSCLVLLLPHGYEGQGPEHSSGRPERFLQLIDDDGDDVLPFSKRSSNTKKKQWLEDGVNAVRQAYLAIKAGNSSATKRAMTKIALLQESYDARHNMSVVNISTPANLFHVLRRQVHRSFAKPLVVMSAKYLLHHRPCRSPLAHMAEGTRFQPVIVEGGDGDNMTNKNAADVSCERLIFCSGKIFYELYHARASMKRQRQVALARLEQIAPFPHLEIALCAMRYPNAELCWVQEEPKNMGAWRYVAPRVATAMRMLTPHDLCMDGKVRPLRYIGRPANAVTATPLFKVHKMEARQIVEEAMKPPAES